MHITSALKRAYSRRIKKPSASFSTLFATYCAFDSGVASQSILCAAFPCLFSYPTRMAMCLHRCAISIQGSRPFLVARWRSWVTMSRLFWVAKWRLWGARWRLWAGEVATVGWRGGDFGVARWRLWGGEVAALGWRGGDFGVGRGRSRNQAIYFLVVPFFLSSHEKWPATKVLHPFSAKLSWLSFGKSYGSIRVGL